MSRIAIGVALLVLGTASTTLGVLRNNTPRPIGPVPVIGGVAMTMVGLILVISHL